ncbi:unnamed protein product [Lampetra fluviatilis]
MPSSRRLSPRSAPHADGVVNPGSATPAPQRRPALSVAWQESWPRCRPPPVAQARKVVELLRECRQLGLPLGHNGPPIMSQARFFCVVWVALLPRRHPIAQPGGYGTTIEVGYGITIDGGYGITIEVGYGITVEGGYGEPSGYDEESGELSTELARLKRSMAMALIFWALIFSASAWVGAQAGSPACGDGGICGCEVGNVYCQDRRLTSVHDAIPVDMVWLYLHSNQLLLCVGLGVSVYVSMFLCVRVSMTVWPTAHARLRKLRGLGGASSATSSNDDDLPQAVDLPAMEEEIRARTSGGPGVQDVAASKNHEILSLVKFKNFKWVGGHLENIMKLPRYENQLTALPKGVFDKLPQLTRLDLENNWLSALPDGVFEQLVNLKELVVCKTTS